MTTKEFLLRKAFLLDQAAELCRQDATRHELKAQRLREEAALLREAEHET